MTSARQNRRGVVLIAGGVGITPLRALFETLPGKVTLIYRAGTAKDLLFRPELEHIAATRNARFIPAIGHRGSNVDVTRPAVLRSLAPDIADCDVYICGPSGLMQSVRSSARALGVPRRRIHIEDFDF
jgi:ferredoxin-NADP reductase